MTKLQVLSIGNFTEDIIFNTDEAEVITTTRGRSKQRYIAFDYGAKYPARSVYRTFGGAALNTVISMAAQGLKAQPLSVVGDDLVGRALLHHLKQKGIKTNLVKILPGQQTAFSFVVNLLDNGEHVLFVSREASLHFRIQAQDLRGIKSDWLMLTSLSGAYAQHNLRTIFQWSGAGDIKVFWNPGHQQLSDYKLIRRYASQVNVFSLNKKEAQDLLKKSGVSTTKSLEILAKKLFTWGFGSILITQGKAGAFYFDGQHALKIVSQKVTNVINSTGAGDAFNSAWLAAYIRSKGDLQWAGQVAVRNAAAILRTIGAHQGVLSLKDLEK
ncbi:MAG: carbohydrate kinase family protein [Candidatus Komeilibacteria bacterium]